MKNYLEKMEKSSTIISISPGAMKFRKVGHQNGVINRLLAKVSKEAPKGEPDNLPGKLIDESYREINSISFRDDFKILVKHYRF